ncbi:MAG TPA: hypothetical protein VL328_11585 [Gemmatimonadaceae bacterium]|nr:hypothetical protein [Gemmatimonadaceae bacterium]
MRSPIHPTLWRTTARLTVTTLLLAVAASCASEARTPTEPRARPASAKDQQTVAAGAPIVVASSAELVAALASDAAGRRILIRAGSYEIDQALVVPDGVTLEGEGVMQLDESRLPVGFEAGTRTTLVMAADVPGAVLTLGDGVVLRRLAIEDLTGRPGVAVGVVSRGSGDRVAATIEDVEIVNPNPTGVAPQGPTGCGIAVLTLNPNMGNAPAPHEGAVVGARISRSIIRSPAAGPGCGLFAFNFAPRAEVSVTVSDAVVGGGIIASGGVSRPDAVHDSRTVISSRRTLYRDDTPDACASSRVGWLLQGGTGVPVPLPVAATERNSLRLHSEDDRVEGFANAVVAVGGRRFFAKPLAGVSAHNSVDLQLLRTRIVTPACEGTDVADFQLAGGFSADASVAPGDGNTLRALLRGVTGSGARANVYADLLGPGGPLPAGTSGNRLEIVGNPREFTRTNYGIDPSPDVQFFSAASR